MSDATVATAASHEPAPQDALAHALARLAASRAALQRQMSPPPVAQGKPARSGLPMAGRWLARLAAMWRQARWRARHQPVLATLLNAIEQRWQGHPWRVPSELALIELRARLMPLVQRHPWASVTLAAGVGAAVMAVRPWRPRETNRSRASRPRRLAAWLTGELRHLPLQALLTQWLMAVSSEPPAADTDPAPRETTTPPASP